MNEIQYELIEEAEGLINLKINSRPKLYAALATAARASIVSRRSFNSVQSKLQ